MEYLPLIALGTLLILAGSLCVLWEREERNAYRHPRPPKQARTPDTSRGWHSLEARHEATTRLRPPPPVASAMVPRKPSTPVADGDGNHVQRLPLWPGQR